MSRLFRQVLSQEYAQVNLGKRFAEIIVNGDLEHCYIIKRSQVNTALEIQETLKQKFGGKWLLVA